MEETNFASGQTSTKRSSFGASIIMVIIFFLVLALWGGMKWYLKTLDATLSQGQGQFDQTSKDFRGKPVDRLVAVDTRLSFLEDQMNDVNHIEPEVFFSQIEKLIIPGVRMSKYEVNMKTRSATVTGITNSFKYVAQQINQFKTDTFFKGTTIESSQKDEAGMITFSLNVSF